MIKKSELKGILILVAIILVIGFIMSALSGNLEKWFGIKWFSGPNLVDSIVYVSEKDGTADLFSMSADGENEKKLTNYYNVSSLPAISNTGRRILFAGRSGENSNIYSIPAKGGEPQIFTTATGPKAHPDFSPDGNRASYIASGRVYIAEIDGKSAGQALPTQQQMREIMTIGGEKKTPPYKFYQWTNDSRGMVGITTDNDSDILIYLPSLAEDAVFIAGITEIENGKSAFAMLPNFSSDPAAVEVSQKAKLNIIDMVFSKNKTMLFASAKIQDEALLVAFDKEEKLPPIIMKTNEYEFFDLALSPDDNVLFACFKLKTDEPDFPKQGIVSINFSDGSFEIIAEGEFSNISFSPDGKKLLSTIHTNNQRDIAIIDLSNGNIKKMTTDGKSYFAVWTPSSEK